MYMNTLMNHHTYRQYRHDINDIITSNINLASALSLVDSEASSTADSFSSTAPILGGPPPVSVLEAPAQPYVHLRFVWEASHTHTYTYTYIL